jgi:hypothetical protein
MVDIYIGPSAAHWVLHSKLLSARSAHFRRAISTASKTAGSTTIRLPDDDEAPFALLVGWLYSGRIPAPAHESDVGALLELHLMGERWGMPRLACAALGAVRAFYRRTDSFPSLRRVQYACACSAEDSELRRLMVGSMARMLVLGEGEVPAHWERALRRDGPMAFDVIRAVREWGLEAESVPDVRWEGEEKSVEVDSNGVGVEEMSENESDGGRRRSELDAVATTPWDVETLASMKGVQNGVPSHD